jgi:hypothetical protein
MRVGIALRYNKIRRNLLFDCIKLRMKWYVNIGIKVIPVKPILANCNAECSSVLIYILLYPKSQTVALKQIRANVIFDFNSGLFLNATTPANKSVKAIIIGGIANGLKVRLNICSNQDV